MGKWYDEAWMDTVVSLRLLLFFIILSTPAHVCHGLLPGSRLNIKTVFSGMMIPMLKIRRSWDRLIFNMGIPILVRRHLYIETASRFIVNDGDKLRLLMDLVQYRTILKSVSDNCKWWFRLVKGLLRNNYWYLNLVLYCFYFHHTICLYLTITNNKATLLLIMVWCWVVDKPLFKPLISFINSLAPGGIWLRSQISKFQTHLNDNYRK